MRYWVYDEDGKLFRKFWGQYEAEKFLQEGWRLHVEPKPKKKKPTVEEFGEARW